MFEAITSHTDIRGNTRSTYETETQVTYVEFITNKTQLLLDPLRAAPRAQVLSRVFDHRFSVQRAEQHLPFRVVTM
jgi:hypothetical protein